MDHDIVLNLKVVDRDGVVKADLSSGVVALAGGVGFRVESDPDDGAVEITADIAAGEHDPYYLEKFNKLVGGGHGPGTGYDYEFIASATGGWYVATINNLRPFNTERDRNFALVGGACMQVGDFDSVSCGDPDVPVLAHPDSQAARLKLFNMCVPDVDCEDYRRMFVYLEEIRKAVDGNKDDNLDWGSSSSSEQELKLFKQYEATIHYWNFMVMNKGFTFDMSVGLSQIALTTGYEAVVCGAYTDVSWTIEIEQLNGPPVAMEHNMRSRKSSRTDLRPVPSGTNPMDVVVPGVMRTRDYALLNSVIKLDADPEASASSPLPPTSSTSGDEGVPAEFAIRVSWSNTHIPGGSSLTKRVTVLVKDI